MANKNKSFEKIYECKKIKGFLNIISSEKDKEN